MGPKKPVLSSKINALEAGRKRGFKRTNRGGDGTTVNSEGNSEGIESRSNTSSDGSGRDAEDEERRAGAPGQASNETRILLVGVDNRQVEVLLSMVVADRLREEVVVKDVIVLLYGS